MAKATRLVLDEVLAAWGTPAFGPRLKRALLALPPTALPLQEAVAQGGLVQDGARDLLLLECAETGDRLRCRLGVFFTETVGGCSCGDEPFSAPAYCEIRLDIDKASAEARCVLL